MNRYQEASRRSPMTAASIPPKYFSGPSATYKSLKVHPHAHGDIEICLQGLLCLTPARPHHHRGEETRVPVDASCKIE